MLLYARLSQKISTCTTMYSSPSSTVVSSRISNENGIEKPCFFKVLRLRVKNLQETKAPFEN